jgi:predicted alpha/beta hydrolase family esterase
MKLPYAEVEFDKEGVLVEPEQVEDAQKLIHDKQATDVLVVSHGWNTTHGDARALYERLVKSMVAVRPEVPGANSRRFVVIGVLWPSIQWAAPENDGAGAGIGDAMSDLEAELARQVRDRKLRRKLLKLVPELETSATARREFVELLRTELPGGATDDDDPDSAPEALRDADPETVLEAAAGAAEDDAAAAAVGGAAAIDPAGLPALDETGAGAGFDFGGILEAARNVLNVTTYFTMKERAGVVGEKGIAKLLKKLHAEADDARLHLIGHSFGGRAVTAAALVTSAPVSSICLLQAAFSHYGMAQGWDGAQKNGVFWKVPEKIDGPVIITFTENDKAVGLAYPVASRIARQIGAGLGDADDKYGGIGRNGALKTPASLRADTLHPVGARYTFTKGKVSSLNADEFVKGHGDVTGQQVAYAVLSAVMVAD